MAISRSREYDADAASAKYVGSPYPLINGLQKLERLVEANSYGRHPLYRTHVHHQAVQLAAPSCACSRRTPRLQTASPACRRCDERSQSQPQGLRTGGRRPSVDLHQRRNGSRSGSTGRSRESSWIRAAAPLGMAHYSSSSQIALRMLTDQVEEIDREFYLRPPARRRSASPKPWCAIPMPIAWSTAKPICCPR